MREMSFDLNVDVVSVNSASDETDSKITNDSGTSNSSIINADESPATITDAYSSSTPNTICGLNLDVCENLVTREFFPVEGVSELKELGCRSSSSATSLLRPQWLNLCVPKSGEVKVFEQQQVRKSRRGPRSRSSQYRGVTFYRRTGRWESHIWDCGKQVYLGGFDTAHAAARAYDRAAIKFRGIDADINFSISDYDEDMKQMTNMTKEECVQILRRQSNGLSRGSSKYRALTLNKCGQWEARMGQVLGKKAYDKEATEGNGLEAVSNFEPSSCKGEVNLDANDGGSGHNLDLNLWISPPSNGPKGNFHFADYQLADAKRLKAESAASAPMGGQTPYDRTMASKHLPIRPGMFSGFMPNYEERATGKREGEVIPLVGFSNWAWQMQGHGMVKPLPLPLFSTAASSGFSSAIPPFSTSRLPLNSHNNHNR